MEVCDEECFGVGSGSVCSGMFVQKVLYETQEALYATRDNETCD